MISHNYDLLAQGADWVVVEGAGGWFAPINERQTMADLAWALSVPALMVVGLKLGCLNHAQLTRIGIESHGVSFAGWVACGVDPEMARAPENVAALERLLGEPPLALIGYAPESVPQLVLEPLAAQLVQRPIRF
jgi:dethiobiotin synthetase